MSEKVSSASHAAASLASMNLPPDAVHAMLRDPAISSGIDMGSLLGDVDTNRGWKFQHARAIYLRERGLPPAVAQEPSRRILLSQFTRQNKREFVTLDLAKQTYIGADPRHSLEDLNNLKKSA